MLEFAVIRFYDKIRINSRESKPGVHNIGLWRAGRMRSADRGSPVCGPRNLPQYF